MVERKRVVELYNNTFVINLIILCIIITLFKNAFQCLLKASIVPCQNKGLRTYVSLNEIYLWIFEIDLCMVGALDKSRREYWFWPKLGTFSNLDWVERRVKSVYAIWISSFLKIKFFSYFGEVWKISIFAFFSFLPYLKVLIF